MASSPNRALASSQLFLILQLAISSSFFAVSADERSLVVSQSTALQLSHGLAVERSPGAKSGAKVVCERINIHGLSRLRNLQKFAHSVKVKLSQVDADTRFPNVEVCFHRNASLGLGMCPLGRWEKVVKGSWVRSMSPFDHKLLDVRATGSSLEAFEVSIEEEYFLYRTIFLILGVLMMTSASFLSKSLVFYYSSAMAIGIVLVILMVLFQGMKLLPTGRKNSLAIFIYSSLIGLGSFLLRFVPGLLRSVLVEIGISEDMYNPLAIFLLGFVILAGAWLGFWVVRKLVLAEDGSVDISTSHFVAWSIRIVAAMMILQSSLDPLLAMEALLAGIISSSILRKLNRLRIHIHKNLLKSSKKSSRKHQVSGSSPSEHYSDEDDLQFKSVSGSFLEPPYANHHRKSPLSDYSSPSEHYRAADRLKVQSPLSARSKLRSPNFTLGSCSSPVQGSTPSPQQLLDSKIHFSSHIHKTPEWAKVSKNEMGEITRASTKRALEELVSSPDFSRWAAANAERLTLAPKDGTKATTGWRKLLPWL